MAAMDENKKTSFGRNNNSSGLKRHLRDRSSSPINSEDIGHIPSNVLVQSFNCKRSRININFQSSPCFAQSRTCGKTRHDGDEELEDSEIKGGKNAVSTNNADQYRLNVSNDNHESVGIEMAAINSGKITESSPDETEFPLLNSETVKDPDVAEHKDNSQENGLDDDSNCDNVSELSGLSDLSMESRWNSSAGMIVWVQNQIAQGTDPRVVLSSLVPDDTEIPEDFDDRTLWQLIVSIISEPPRRKQLPNITTLESVIHLLRTCKKIVVLTGAGVSVSCGIPDFRSRDGIYARLAVDYPDLPDPQAMFDIQYFKKNPRPFFKFAKEIYPGQFSPSVSHRFIGQLESSDQLLRNYTQNIDTLESAAGITRVVQCHGSFASATCMVCKYKVDVEAVRDDIMNQVIPRCRQCSPETELAILKPDIVFFGESLSEEFHQQIQSDKDECDLLIVIGSSLKVRPVAIIPSIIPANVPQVLINREPLKHLNFDVELLGDCDVIINELCHLLGDGFKPLCTSREAATLLTRESLIPHSLSDQVPDTGIHDASPALESSQLPKPEDEENNRAAGPKTEAGGATEIPKSDGTSVSEDIDRDFKNRHKPQTTKIADYLKDNSFLHLPPRRYVFTGAEVYEEDDELYSDTDSSSECSGGAEYADAEKKQIQDDSCVQDDCHLNRVETETQVKDYSDQAASVDKRTDNEVDKQNL